MQPQRGLLGAVIGLLVSYHVLYYIGLAAGDTADTAEAGLIDVVCLVKCCRLGAVTKMPFHQAHPNRALGC